ncbi:MAG: hypothetical protein AAGH92_00850 [Planctomycetota bacterium]
MSESDDRSQAVAWLKLFDSHVERAAKNLTADELFVFEVLAERPGEEFTSLQLEMKTGFDPDCLFKVAMRLASFDLLSVSYEPFGSPEGQSVLAEGRLASVVLRPDGRKLFQAVTKKRRDAWAEAWTWLKRHPMIAWPAAFFLLMGWFVGFIGGTIAIVKAIIT